MVGIVRTRILCMLNIDQFQVDKIDKFSRTEPTFHKLETCNSIIYHQTLVPQFKSGRVKYVTLDNVGK